MAQPAVQFKVPTSPTTSPAAAEIAEEGRRPGDTFLNTKNRLIDPHPSPPGVYFSAYPQGSSMFPSEVTTRNINEYTNIYRKQLFLFCTHTNIQMLNNESNRLSQQSRV